MIKNSLTTFCEFGIIIIIYFQFSKKYNTAEEVLTKSLGPFVGLSIYMPTLFHFSLSNSFLIFIFSVNNIGALTYLLIYLLQIFSHFLKLKVETGACWNKKILHRWRNKEGEAIKRIEWRNRSNSTVCPGWAIQIWRWYGAPTRSRN